MRMCPSCGFSCRSRFRSQFRKTPSTPSLVQRRLQAKSSPSVGSAWPRNVDPGHPAIAPFEPPSPMLAGLAVVWISSPKKADSAHAARDTAARAVRACIDNMAPPGHRANRVNQGQRITGGALAKWSAGSCWNPGYTSLLRIPVRFAQEGGQGHPPCGGALRVARIVAAAQCDDRCASCVQSKCLKTKSFPTGTYRQCGQSPSPRETGGSGMSCS